MLQAPQVLRDGIVHLSVYWLIKSGSYSGFKVNVKGLILKSASAKIHKNHPQPF